MKNAYVETLDKAYVKLSDRQTNYGPEASRFERLSKIASIMLNKPISMYDAAMILHCDKMARLQENRCDTNSYVDGINYLALASEFASNQFSIETAAEDDVKAQVEAMKPKVEAHHYVEALNEMDAPTAKELEEMKATGQRP